MAIGVGLLLLLSVHAVSAQQVKRITTCPLLTNAEAAAVLGPGTVFVSGFEAPGGENVTLRCEFEQGDGDRRLTVDTWKTLGDKSAWEALRKLSNGTMEPGLGDYAFSYVEGGPRFWAAKGAQTLEMKVAGKGASSVELAKLRDAAKKAVPRF